MKFLQLETGQDKSGMHGMMSLLWLRRVSKEWEHNLFQELRLPRCTSKQSDHTLTGEELSLEGSSQTIDLNIQEGMAMAEAEAEEEVEAEVGVEDE